MAKRYTGFGRIEFRAKAIDSGEWVYGNNVVADPEQASINGVAVDFDTIGLFTHYLDEDGNKIFTGDKIKWSDDGEVTVIEATRLLKGIGTLDGAKLVGNIYEME